MAREFKVTVEGAEEITRLLMKLGADAPHAQGAALYEEAQGLITEAQQETPVDTGALRASGTVQLPEISAIGATVECGFGGPAVPYAVEVHENMEAHHNPPTKAKFLEDPFNRRQAGFEQRMARRLDMELRLK